MRHLLRISVVFVIVLLVVSCAPPKGSGKKKGESKNKISGIKKDLGVIVKKLIKSKGNLNQRYDSRLKKDNKMIPILVWAIGFNDVASVKLLLKHGANPNIPQMKGGSEIALFEVCQSTDLVTEKYVNILNTRKLSRKICKLLIRAGAKVNHQNNMGDTALMKAARSGREDICSILISAGAKVNTRNVMGATALHAAAGPGYWKVAKLLVRKKARVSAKDKMKQTALSIAKKREDEDLYKKSRKVLPGSYKNADYNKTIAVLKK